jgi:hypothetical protein
MPLAHGQPHLWAATPVKPYPWRPSAAVLPHGAAVPSTARSLEAAWESR